MLHPDLIEESKKLISKKTTSKELTKKLATGSSVDNHAELVIDDGIKILNPKDCLPVRKIQNKVIIPNTRLPKGQIRQEYSLNIVALQKRVPYITEEGKSAFKVNINDSPLPMDVIEADDVVVLVGSEKNFNRLFADLAQG